MRDLVSIGILVFAAKGIYHWVQEGGPTYVTSHKLLEKKPAEEETT